MEDLDIDCADQSDDSLNVSFRDDRVYLMCLSRTSDVALDAEKATQLRDALTKWLEGQS